MAVNDHATLADKICLANDLKYRRDYDYAETLLWHIFPSIPRTDQLMIPQSESLRDWLESDPRGEWCSQNDKAFMYMIATKYIRDNGQSVTALGHMKADDGPSDVKSPEPTQFNDHLKRVIKSWRHPLENSDEVLWESIISEYTGSRSNIPRPKPLDNSISPPESCMGWNESPRLSGTLGQAGASNLTVQPILEPLSKSSQSNDHQGEKCQANLGKFGGTQEEIFKSEEQELEKSLLGMHLDSPNHVVSKQKTSMGSSRAHDAFIMRTQQIRNLQRQFEAESQARASGNALMRACRKKTLQAPLDRRSIRLASRDSYRPSGGPPRKAGGPLSKAKGRVKKTGSDRALRLADRKQRRDQQCDQDLGLFRLDPNVNLSRKRMNRISLQLGYHRSGSKKTHWTSAERAALLEFANTDPSKRKQDQSIVSGRPPTGLSTAEDDSSKADGKNTEPCKRRDRMWEPINAKAGEQHWTNPDDTQTESDSTERRTESMDTS